MVGRPVGPDDSAPIQGQNHRQALQANIVEDLVVGPLHECGVNGYHRNESFGSQTRSKSNPVLFGDSHVEESVGKFLSEGIQARSLGHGRRDANQTWIFPAQLDHGLSEDLCVGEAAAFLLDDLS